MKYEIKSVQLPARRPPDRLPSEGDAGSWSANRTLFPMALPRPLRRLEVLGLVRTPARSSRPAKGVYSGVAGVVDPCCARNLARAARLEGELM